jgi:RNA polymerase sigma-70 factor, ECF subfamily
LTTEARSAGDKAGKVLTTAFAPAWTDVPVQVPRAQSSPASESAPAPERPTFTSVYEEQFDFVFRTVRRLGIAEAAAEDVTQEVFVVVHKSLARFEGRSSVRTWLFGIARNVAYRHRRSLGRRISELPGEERALAVAHDETARSAHDLVERAEAAQVVDALLDELEEEKREAFVLVELEEMSMPEVAEALGINVNTAYTRLRAARRQFEEALVRHRARSARSGAR